MQVYEDGVTVYSPGLPVALRTNENLTIKDNHCWDAPGTYAGGSRLWLYGIDQESVTILTITATGGTFTITYTDCDAAVHTTDPIAWNASAATVQDELRTISTLTTTQGRDLDQVTVSGSAGGPYTITWIEVSYRNRLDMRYVVVSADGASLTGPAPEADSVTTTADPISPGTGIEVTGNVCGNMWVDGDNEEIVHFAGNRLDVAPELTIDSNEPIPFGMDRVAATSDAANNVAVLPKLIFGMSPIEGTIGANGFRMITPNSTDTINGVTADAGATDYTIIPANCQFVCTPTSITNWVVETITAAGVRAPATMVP